MEDEEDDFYAQTGSTQIKNEEEPQVQTKTNGNNGIKHEDEDMNGMEGDEDDEDEDESDDSDIDIITERKDGAVPEAPPQARPFRGIRPEPPRTASTDPASNQQSNQQPLAPKAEPITQAKKVSVSTKDGSKYPEVRSSSIDLNAVPLWDAAGKPITELDMDFDLAEHTKPWRLPGTDQTDFFNYGFDEFTWTQYCLKQQNMSSAINAQKQETKQFEMMLSGGMPPGQPGAQAGPMGMAMPGISDMPPEMMNAMMNSMQSQGISDPSQLDFGTFMQQMQGMGMPGMPGMPGQGGQGGQGGYGAQSMQAQGSNQGFGGQQHGQSPFHQQQNSQYGGGTPQPQQQGQQNFSQQGQGQQQGGMNFEGYSQQQIAMMQGQGGPPQGPGGGQRGRGRGGRRW